MLKNRQENLSINELLKLVEKQKIILPEFQRDFKWSIEKSEVLFDSLFRELFIGSLILAKPQFSLACKGFDLRPRGHKGRKPKVKEFEKKKFENEDIKCLLDGQQRVTSIVRALKGIDDLNVVFMSINILTNDKNYDLKNNKIKLGPDKYIDRIQSKKPKESEFYIKLSDLHRFSEKGREKEFIDECFDPVFEMLQESNENRNILENYAIDLWEFYKKLLHRESLLSVQLLEMDLPKFCLFFERSNSQGMTLSFVDIVNAKVYIDFKLNRHINESKRDFPVNFSDQFVDPIVRYINFLANGEVTKASILKDLSGNHFREFWDMTIKDFDSVMNWLKESNYSFNTSKLPYRTMILPLISFYQNLTSKEFSQATDSQLEKIRFWFFASIIDSRYGGGRQGSTNVILKDDCEMMRDLAKGKPPNKIYWQQFRFNFSIDELKRLRNNSAAEFLGINYLMWSNKNYMNLENNNNIQLNNLEVHHIFPINYIKKRWGENSDEYDFADSILNKIRINKISNIKISDQAPGDYFQEIVKKYKVKDINKSLDSHFIGDVEKLVEGKYDNDMMGFYEQRFKKLEPLFKKLENTHRTLAQ